jgi:uncharacterized protein YcbK (DUF882 family)
MYFAFNRPVNLKEQKFGMNENSNSKIDGGISRRQLLKTGLITAVSTIVPFKAVDAATYILSNTRKLQIYNLHTKEYFDSPYWMNGGYMPEAVKSLEHMFRDHYNGRERRIDPKLLDLLYSIQKKTGINEPFHLISGYRSPDTNARLRSNNRGVAKKSLHMYGKAADIRLPGLSLKKLRRAAYELKAGGVGYYPRSNFVHVDVGRVRYW